MTILQGSGAGTFTPASGSPISVGSSPRWVALGDFNSDGNLDRHREHWQQHGDDPAGQWGRDVYPASGSPISVGSSPQSVVVGDFNGDGKLDLATANQNSSTMTILLGNGDGTFTATSSPSPGTALPGARWGTLTGTASSTSPPRTLARAATT